MPDQGDSENFEALSGEETLERLSRLPPRKRRAVIRKFLYKKGKRPSRLEDQIVLLEALHRDPAITDFDRLYALIAVSHKVCETVQVDASQRWLARMLELEPQIRSMRIGYGLRKDRTHLVFSALNVAMNLDLLTGARHLDRLADWFFHELKALNPRRMTPYLFNTNSNTVKCAGLALLARPDALSETAVLMRRLVSYGIEINNPVHWVIFSRLRAPATLAEVSERAAFGSHCNTILRLRAIEDAAATTSVAARNEAMLTVGGLCIAQANQRQRQALLDAVETILRS